MNNKNILIGAIAALVVALGAAIAVVGIGEMNLKNPDSTSGNQGNAVIESTVAENTVAENTGSSEETTADTTAPTAGTTGNETTAGDETVPGQTTQGESTATKPTKPNKTEDDGFEEHKPSGSTGSATKPTTKPTDPPKPPVIEDGKTPTFNGKALKEFTYVDYVNMEVSVEQPAFIAWATEQLGSRQAFKEWYKKVQAEYNDSQTQVVIGGGNSIDLGELINGINNNK